MKELTASSVFFRDRFVPFKDATFSIASSPIMYGLCIYTVFPVNWNIKSRHLTMFRLRDHFGRLQNSARIMGMEGFIENWDYDRFVTTMRQLLEKNEVKEDGLVRVYVFVDGTMNGTKIHGLDHQLAAFVYPYEPYLPLAGARLGVSSWRRTPDNAIPARAKINGGYANSALMKNEALLNGYDDAVALDEQGHVAESSVSNIFMVRDGMVITPSNSTDLLEGITRSTIFSLAKDLEIDCYQKSIDRSELYLAEEIFLSGSSVRVTPVTSIDNRPVGKGNPGPITKKIMAAYQEASHGNDLHRGDWCTEV